VLVPKPIASLVAASLLLLACSKREEPAPVTKAPVASAARAEAPAAFDAGSLGSVRTAPARVVAIGDLHGDLDATRRVLRLAGAIDAADAWVGGELVLVQTGDQIDRGDDDRRILDLFDRLKEEAAKTGGQVVALVGNHEVMNASFDFRYVTEGAFTAFRDVNANVPSVPGLASEQRGRAAAFAPGGPYAKRLASRPVVARVGDSVFVHGGVLPKYVRSGLDALNEGTRAWLAGDAKEPPRGATAEDGPLWTRAYSAAPGREECAWLAEALELLHAKRMVMGHTPQKPGIQSACDGRAWRIDTGMAKAYGGPIQALEIKGEGVTVLKER